MGYFALATDRKTHRLFKNIATFCLCQWVTVTFLSVQRMSHVWNFHWCANTHRSMGTLKIEKKNTNLYLVNMENVRWQTFYDADFHLLAVLMFALFLSVSVTLHVEHGSEAPQTLYCFYVYNTNLHINGHSTIEFRFIAHSFFFVSLYNTVSKMEWR